MRCEEGKGYSPWMKEIMCCVEHVAEQSVAQPGPFMSPSTRLNVDFGFDVGPGSSSPKSVGSVSRCFCS
jgi:hypothetical protein